MLKLFSECFIFALHSARNSAASHFAKKFPSSQSTNPAFCHNVCHRMFLCSCSVTYTPEQCCYTHKTEQGMAPLGRAPLCLSEDLKERVTTILTAQCQGEQSGLQMITWSSCFWTILCCSVTCFSCSASSSGNSRPAFLAVRCLAERAFLDFLWAPICSSRYFCCIWRSCCVSCSHSSYCFLCESSREKVNEVWYDLIPEKRRWALVSLSKAEV